ncbi:MAG: 2-iminoacetate synthase ThiH [Candidatus Desulfatibia sp.]|jgi:2-iminoacetate synthase|uniref:2-iminoacetate synthase ThiH n=1 Tax=Candidatus Desulfatibia sp. TaxID=3101189 RepID=UPI002F2FFEBE
MSFYEKISRLRWEEIEKQIMSRTPADVAKALAARSLGMDGFISLLSPAAEQAMEEMAQRAHRLTQQRFGRVISLFAPLYLSNECTNACVYCGFNVQNTVDRLTIALEQAEAEASFLYSQGFRHILLVSGEAPQAVTMEYLTKILQKLRHSFSSISIELYPMPTVDYQNLITNGVDGLVVYQETYNEKRYRDVHPAGNKSNYRWRLETPERGGEAGFRRIGIGALLGLDNWRVEGFFLALHARYLLRNFWKSHITISFPRLRPAAGEYEPPYPVSDAQFVQLITALRLLLPDAGLVLSTRESAYLRDNLIPIGITSMSAGSCTAPGGYAHEVQAEAQFDIADHRSPKDVAAIIRAKGYEPVWKDWDAAFLQ